MDIEKERRGKDSRQFAPIVLSDSLEFLERQSSLHITQSRQSNERLIQEYNVAQKQWSQGAREATQRSNRDRDSGNGSQRKPVLQAMGTTSVERPNDSERSVISAFQGHVIDGQSMSAGTAGRWTNDWVVQTSDINTEPVPAGRLQPLRIELQSPRPTGERMSQISDPNTSLSSGFKVSEDTPNTMALWREETDWKRHREGNSEQNLVYRDDQADVIPDQQPKGHVDTRRRYKSAGPVMSGATRFGWTGSDSENDKGRSLSIDTDPKRSLRRHWTTDWVGQLGDRNEGNEFPSSVSLPPIRIQGQFRPVSRQRGDPVARQTSLPSMYTQGQHRTVSRQRSDPGARLRNSSGGSYDAPMTVAYWLEHHAWSSHTKGLWRYPSYPQDGHSDEATHWRPRERRRARSADPLLSLHRASRAQQTRSRDENGKGQGYRHPSSRRRRSRSRGSERSDPGRTERRVSNSRRRSRRRSSTKRDTKPQPPIHPPVKVEKEETHGENTTIEQNDENENPEEKANLVERIGALLLHLPAALLESVFGALLAGDKDSEDSKTTGSSDGRQGGKENTQEKNTETPGAKQPFIASKGGGKDKEGGLRDQSKTPGSGSTGGDDSKAKKESDPHDVRTGRQHPISGALALDSLPLSSSSLLARRRGRDYNVSSGKK